MITDADELVKMWARTKVRHHVPMTADYLHYRDCPDIEVYECRGSERALSSVTPDEWTYFEVVWGCPHGPGRLAASIHYAGKLIELIGELDNIHAARADIQADIFNEEMTTSLTGPLFAANYAAPKGTVWRGKNGG